MGKTPAKHELILLFNQLEIEPKKMHKWLAERGQIYSYHTLQKYYGYWATAKLMAQSIVKMNPMLRKEVDER